MTANDPKQPLTSTQKFAELHVPTASAQSIVRREVHYSIRKTCTVAY